MFTTRYCAKFFTIIALIGLLSVSGCRRIHVYGDSTVSDKDNPPTQLTVEAIADASHRTMWPVIWRGVPGKSMYGPVGGHPIRNEIDAMGSSAFGEPDVVVLALGTNDAGKWARNPTGAESYPVGAAYWHAQHLINNAAEAGATCVIWVLPTSDHRSLARESPAQAIVYRDYVNAFNNWLRNNVGSHQFSGNEYEFHVADWGPLADQIPSLTVDGVHPNSTGAAVMGTLIKTKIQECPTGRWDWGDEMTCNIETQLCHEF